MSGKVLKFESVVKEADLDRLLKKVKDEFEGQGLMSIAVVAVYKDGSAGWAYKNDDGFWQSSTLIGALEALKLRIWMNERE